MPVSPMAQSSVVDLGSREAYRPPPQNSITGWAFGPLIEYALSSNRAFGVKHRPSDLGWKGAAVSSALWSQAGPLQLTWPWLRRLLHLQRE